MDTKSAGIGSLSDASGPATVVAEGVPGGRPASAAIDGDAACTPDASLGSAPSGSSDRRAGAAGTAPTPAPSRVTPERALRNALALCDYLIRDWSGPGMIGAMPSVEKTRDDVIAGLLACEAEDYGMPPRPMLLAETHARLRALAAGHGTTALAVTIWDHEDFGQPWSQRVEWSACVFVRGSSKRIAAHTTGEDPEKVLAQIALALALVEDLDPAVIALGELPKVTT